MHRGLVLSCYRLLSCCWFNLDSNSKSSIRLLWGVVVTFVRRQHLVFAIRAIFAVRLQLVVHSRDTHFFLALPGWQDTLVFRLINAAQCRDIEVYLCFVPALVVAVC